jgi:hypothetical protein
METEPASEDTGMLHLELLQVDIQMLQKYREEDKQKFLDFSNTVKANFVSVQNNFTSIQSNFEKLFAARKLDASEHFGHTPETPPNQGFHSAESVTHQRQSSWNRYSSGHAGKGPQLGWHIEITISAPKLRHCHHFAT